MNEERRASLLEWGLRLLILTPMSLRLILPRKWATPAILTLSRFR
jgi:hypothetical protein